MSGPKTTMTIRRHELRLMKSAWKFTRIGSSRPMFQMEGTDGAFYAHKINRLATRGPVLLMVYDGKTLPVGSRADWDMMRRLPWWTGTETEPHFCRKSFGIWVEENLK